MHRYKLLGSDTIHEVTAANLSEHLDAIYANQVQRYVDGTGTVLPASNSEPGFVMRVLERLDLRPGQRVLEVGSGGGWLAAVMGKAVGPTGGVTGIEIIEELATQSRRDLRAAGMENVQIVSADGAKGWPAGAPYDRVMFTVGTYDLPIAFFDQVRDGGLLAMPFQNRAKRGFACDFLVLRRSGDRFHAVASMPAFFVKFQGEKGGDADPIVDLASLALCRPGELVGYGSPAAFERFMAGYRAWCDLGMPPSAGLDVVVCPNADVARAPPGSWLDRRGDAALIWSAKQAMA